MQNEREMMGERNTQKIKPKNNQLRLLWARVYVCSAAGWHNTDLIQKMKKQSCRDDRNEQYYADDDTYNNGTRDFVGVMYVRAVVAVHMSR